MLSTGSAKKLKRTLLMLLNRFMFGWISDGTLTFILINLHSEIQSLEKVRYVPFLPCELCKSTTSRFTKFNAIITAFTTLKKLVAILRHTIHYCSIGPCYILALNIATIMILRLRKKLPKYLNSTVTKSKIDGLCLVVYSFGTSDRRKTSKQLSHLNNYSWCLGGGYYDFKV